MNDDVLINKASIIIRCLQRIKEDYNKTDFSTNLTKQDAILLNVQRACEAVIDMGNRVIRLNQLAVPQSSRDIFAILTKANLLSDKLGESMQKMVGLRNIAVHEYQQLDLDIVAKVIEHHLSDFTDVAQSLLTSQDKKSD